MVTVFPRGVPCVGILPVGARGAWANELRRTRYRQGRVGVVMDLFQRALGPTAARIIAVKHRENNTLWTLMLLPLISIDSSLSIAGESPVEAKGRSLDGATEMLVVKSSLREPAVPLELVLTVRLFAKKRLLKIAGRIGKHPAYPAELFFDKHLKVQIKLPEGLQLQEGSLTWQGDLRGDEAGQVRATVKAVRDLEDAVEASAVGDAAVGGRVDAVSIRFHVLAKGNAMRISRDPFTPFKLQPGTATQER